MGVDWIKYPYQTQCRFTDNPDVVSTIQWSVVRPGAQLLPFPSRVCNLFLEPDKESYDDPVGEIYDGYGRPANWVTTPAGITGQRFCGNASDFALGGVYDPDAPPAVYGRNGWLLCCAQIPVLFGAAGGGGRVSPFVQRPIRVYGGAAGNGSCRVSVISLDAPRGGGSGGGTILDQLHTTDALVGGGSGGGTVRDAVQFTDAPVGGGSGGGAVADAVSYTDAPSGGGSGGGTVSDEMVGNLDTSNETGGPFSFSGTITLIGGTNVTLVPGVNTVTINVTSVGPSPGTPTALSARPANGVIQYTWTAPTGFPNPQNYTLATAPNSGFTSGVQVFPLGNVTSFVATGQTNGIANYAQVAAGFNGLNGPFSTAANATPQNYVSWDDCIDTNGVTWAAHVMNIGASGNFTTGWIVNPFSGSFNAGITTISSDTLQVVKTGTTNSIPVAQVETGQANVTIKVTALKSCVQVGVVFSYSDLSNYWLFYSDGTNVYWAKQVGGVFTFVPTPVAFSWPNGVSHTFTVIRSGSSIILKVDGTTYYTLSDSDLDSNTKHGLYTECGPTESANYTAWQVTSP